MDFPALTDIFFDMMNEDEAHRPTAKQAHARLRHLREGALPQIAPPMVDYEKDPHTPERLQQLRAEHGR